MSIRDNVQYVLVTSTGRHINVFHDESRGICVSVLNNRNRWTMPQVVFRNCLQWFSACLDDGNDLHIAFQDLRGDIIHMVHRNGVWQRSIVLQAKKPAKYNKHIHIMSGNEGVYLFYVVMHADDHILSFQTVNHDGKAGTPRALDYIEPGEDAYVLCRDGKNVCLGYNRVQDGVTHPGYRWFDMDAGKASEFIALPEKDYSIGALVAEKRARVHFCIGTKTDSGYAVYHVARGEKTGEWSDKTLISESRFPFEIPTLQLQDRKLKCFWLQGRFIKGCSSGDGGKTWESLQEYALDGKYGIHFVEYSDSYLRTSYFSQFNRVLCRFINGVNIVYANGEGVNRQEIQTASMGPDLGRGSRESQGDIEEIKRRLQQMEEALLSLEKKVDIFGIEIEKLKIGRAQWD